MKLIFFALILLMMISCQYQAVEKEDPFTTIHRPNARWQAPAQTRPPPPPTVKIPSSPMLTKKSIAQEKQGPSLKIYKVHYADPAEVAKVIPLMMPSPEGFTLETVDRKLVVRGTPAQHEVVRTMLRDLDAPPKNIQVLVHFNTRGGSYNKEAGIRPRGPMVIDRGGVHGSLQGRLRDQSTSSRENTTQMLVAADGRSASIRVGESVPHIAWLTEYGRRWGYVRNVGIEWRDVGSFLAMEPTLVGSGMIRIRLIPELSGRLENGERHRIQFTHLATEVTVRDGQTLSIGGFSKDKDFSSKFLIGRSRHGESTITDITLTPHILD